MNWTGVAIMVVVAAMVGFSFNLGYTFGRWYQWNNPKDFPGRKS